MVHDNPYLEVRRSFPLDQTELNIFCKWSKLNQFGKIILTSHGFTPTYLKFELIFCGHWWQRGREIHKDGKDMGANNSIVL
jgi:hypothetical protein